LLLLLLLLVLWVQHSIMQLVQCSIQLSHLGSNL
jgi:hypothetical protein